MSDHFCYQLAQAVPK